MSGCGIHLWEKTQEGTAADSVSLSSSESSAAAEGTAGTDGGADAASDAGSAAGTGVTSDAGSAGGANAASEAGSAGVAASGSSEKDQAAADSSESADARDDLTVFLNPGDAALGFPPLLDDPEAETVYVTAVSANVRSEADKESTSLGIVRQGMSLLRYEEGDDWSEVRYCGERAYIRNDLISDEPPHTVISSHDQDGDGIDDQTEILQNARAYVATRPIYESRYYDSGYPDDGYGVCSDIIAFAMRDAGYDLRQLLADDIAAAPAAYAEIREPDSKIDFRRVVNLLVYFDRHFIPKTTDLSQLDEWQGGDIIFFDHHIAVVSDRRNAEGIPYIIHHRSKSQISYEEDYLGIRSDVIAHFRISE